MRLKPWHQASGLDLEGATRIEAALPHALALVEAVKSATDVSLAHTALKEAWFRLVELPKRSVKFRKHYLKENA